MRSFGSRDRTHLIYISGCDRDVAWREREGDLGSVSEREVRIIPLTPKKRTLHSGNPLDTYRAMSILSPPQNI